MSSFIRLLKNSIDYNMSSSYLPQQEEEQQECDGKVLVDYKKQDYRSFCFCIHPIHGLLLLHCTRKKSKPPHYQLPGGHVDDIEFQEAAQKNSNKQIQLLLAVRTGVARELFEETGIDVRSITKQEERLKPVILRKKIITNNNNNNDNDNNNNNSKQCNEFKHRFFFILSLTDEDFHKESNTTTTRLTRAHGESSTNHLLLPISFEHSGFTFEKDPNKAIELLEHHSGGKVSEALKMALQV